MAFADLMIDHLVKYKVKHLPKMKDGVFHFRDKELDKAHVLPRDQERLNILDRYRKSFYASEFSKDIKFHRYFHHLNSSQALCINLFYPLIAEGQLTLVVRSLGISPEDGWNPKFEKSSDVEIAERKTSFDFYLGHPTAGQIYFEVKYTEREFGKAVPDKEHRKKFQETYVPILKNSIYLNESCRDEDLFLSNYQILRNLVHINDTSWVVLLFPKGNAHIARQANESLDRFLTAAGRERLKIVYLESLVSDLEKSFSKVALAGYFDQFREKYFP